MSEADGNDPIHFGQETDPPEDISMPEEGAPHWVWLAVIALAAVSILSLGVAWNASMHVKDAQEQLARQTKALQQNTQEINQRLVQTEESNARLENQLTAMTERLQTTQGEVNTTRRQEVQTRAEYRKNLANVQSELQAKANSDDLKSLGGDVTGVRTDLNATRTDLNSARDQFGGMIARNHDEIDQLRRMGERDYFEFTLDGKGNRSKVGDLMVELRGTNTKRNQFSIALYVDDMRLEKKNRSVDEPIYFYTRGTRTPLELVINQVQKNKIVGYLSVPKPQPAQPASASAASAFNQ